MAHSVTRSNRCIVRQRRRCGFLPPVIVLASCVATAVGMFLPWKSFFTAPEISSPHCLARWHRLSQQLRRRVALAVTLTDDWHSSGESAGPKLERGANDVHDEEDFDDDAWDEELLSMAQGGDPISDTAAQPTMQSGSGGVRDRWLSVPLNDTFAVRVFQSVEADQKFAHVGRGGVTAENAKSKLTAGDMVWGAAVLLARWLVATGPARLGLDGATTLELGAGLGLPSVTAARLGAASVLLQDRSPAPLRGAVETALENGVAGKVATLCCDWQSFLARLAEDDASTYAVPDIVLGSDIVYNAEAVDTIAALLSGLLRRPGQVAYIMDRCDFRERFVSRLMEHGLESAVSDVDLLNGAVGHDLIVGLNAWSLKLITIRRRE